MFSSRITQEELEALEYASFPGRIHVICHPGREFDRAIHYLERQQIIGFDTESKPCFSSSEPKNGVALLQLSGRDEAFLFRVQKLGFSRRLAGILANPGIMKVGAAVLDDIRGLQRYRRFVPGNFVDLQKIVGEWGIEERSVKKMSAIILGMRISKVQQLSNWEADYLNESQEKYAATDAWVCREMYIKLMNTKKPGEE